MENAQITQLMRDAAAAKFNHQQRVFSSVATEYIHAKPTKTATKKHKSKHLAGKIKRHNARKARGLKSGFGSSIGNDTVLFRVEFNWLDKSTDIETNERTDWIECRRFHGREYSFYKRYFDDCEDWNKGETVESKFVTRYIVQYLIKNQDYLDVNQAFIFAASTKKDDQIRELASRVFLAATGEQLKTYKINHDFDIVLKNSIVHHKTA